MILCKMIEFLNAFGSKFFSLKMNVCFINQGCFHDSDFTNFNFFKTLYFISN